MLERFKKYLRRVEITAQRNKIAYFNAQGKIIGKAGGVLSGTAAIAHANRVFNACKWWPVKRYYSTLEAAGKILTGKPFPLTIAARTYPAVAATLAWDLGQEAGFYIPAYIEAW